MAIWFTLVRRIVDACLCTLMEKINCLCRTLNSSHAYDLPRAHWSIWMPISTELCCSGVTLRLKSLPKTLDSVQAVLHSG